MKPRPVIKSYGQMLAEREAEDMRAENMEREAALLANPETSTTSSVPATTSISTETSSSVSTTAATDQSIGARLGIGPAVILQHQKKSPIEKAVEKEDEEMNDDDHEPGEDTEMVEEDKGDEDDTEDDNKEEDIDEKQDTDTESTKDVPKKKALKRPRSPKNEADDEELDEDGDQEEKDEKQDEKQDTSEQELPQADDDETEHKHDDKKEKKKKPNKKSKSNPKSVPTGGASKKKKCNSTQQDLDDIAELMQFTDTETEIFTLTSKAELFKDENDTFKSMGGATVINQQDKDKHMNSTSTASLIHPIECRTIKLAESYVINYKNLLDSELKKCDLQSLELNHHFLYPRKRGPKVKRIKEIKQKMLPIPKGLSQDRIRIDMVDKEMSESNSPCIYIELFVNIDWTITGEYSNQVYNGVLVSMQRLFGTGKGQDQKPVWIYKCIPIPQILNGLPEQKDRNWLLEKLAIKYDNDLQLQIQSFSKSSTRFVPTILNHCDAISGCTSIGYVTCIDCGHTLCENIHYREIQSTQYQSRCVSTRSLNKTNCPNCIELSKLSTLKEISDIKNNMTNVYQNRLCMLHFAFNDVKDTPSDCILDVAFEALIPRMHCPGVKIVTPDDLNNGPKISTRTAMSRVLSPNDSDTLKKPKVIDLSSEWILNKNKRNWISVAGHTDFNSPDRIADELYWCVSDDSIDVKSLESIMGQFLTKHKDDDEEMLVSLIGCNAYKAQDRYLNIIHSTNHFVLFVNKASVEILELAPFPENIRKRWQDQRLPLSQVCNELIQVDENFSLISFIDTTHRMVTFYRKHQCVCQLFENQESKWVITNSTSTIPLVPENSNIDVDLHNNIVKNLITKECAHDEIMHDTAMIRSLLQNVEIRFKNQSNIV